MSVCRQQGIRPIYIYLPFTGNDAPPPDEELASVRTGGFEMIDLSDVFNGYAAEQIALAAWDAHPNATGHRLIAERLFQELSRDGFRLLHRAQAGTDGSNVAVHTR